jgi:hypothetical protein
MHLTVNHHSYHHNNNSSSTQQALTGQRPLGDNTTEIKLSMLWDLRIISRSLKYGAHKVSNMVEEVPKSGPASMTIATKDIDDTKNLSGI